MLVAVVEVDALLRFLDSPKPGAPPPNVPTSWGWAWVSPVVASRRLETDLYGSGDTAHGSPYVRLATYVVCPTREEVSTDPSSTSSD
jgi:hypothetical protein